MKILTLFLLAVIAFAQPPTQQFTQNLTSTGSVTTGVSTWGVASVQLTGTWVATIVFEGSTDGTTFFSVNGMSPTTGAAMTTTTINGQWTFNLAGLNSFRVRASAYTSGTVAVNMKLAGGFAGNMSGVTACDTSAVISVTAASTGQLVALTAGKAIHVCAVFLSMSAAGTAQFQYGTGTNCGTGTTNITGVMNLGANLPASVGSGLGTIWRVPAGNALCVAAVTGNVVGSVTYTVTP